jgi:hypothetical protein
VFADGFGHADDVVIGFEFGHAVHGFLLARSFEADREVPAALGELRALEDREGRFEADGGRDLRVRNEVLKRADRGMSEVEQVVGQRFFEVRPRLFDGGVELLGCAQPVMNGGAVDACLASGGRYRHALGEGGGDAELRARFARARSLWFAGCSGFGAGCRE